jgi:subtilisin family serine protease
VAALERRAAKSQARLRRFLDQARRDGLVRSWQGFAVVDRLLVAATPEGVEALARRPEVVAIHPEMERDAPALSQDLTPPAPLSHLPPSPRERGELAPEKTSWALAAIGAPEAWRRRLDGTGIVVGAIDSGASSLHEQMAAGFRGGPASWYDPLEGSAVPRDNRTGHGTGVLSCAVGRNTSGVTLGVAPGARWIACAGLPNGHYNNVLVTQCADWMLRTGQPDVLVAAWLLPEPGCDRSLQPIVDAWRAAEILPVFAAGNHGPEAHTDRSPANYTGLFPGGRAALSIGGIGRTGSRFATASRGPGACGGSVFPSLAAPAEDLVAAFPIGPAVYRRAQGTSFAAGLTAGAAALLLQARPEASVAEIEDALRAGAADLGTPGADADFGYGRLDVPGALEALGGRGMGTILSSSRSSTLASRSGSNLRAK